MRSDYRQTYRRWLFFLSGLSRLQTLNWNLLTSSVSGSKLNDWFLSLDLRQFRAVAPCRVELSDAHTKGLASLVVTNQCFWCGSTHASIETTSKHVAAAEKHNKCLVDAGRFHYPVIDILPDTICPQCDLIFNAPAPSCFYGISASRGSFMSGQCRNT